MKHLKTYESFGESIEDIKDALLELKDDGWIVKHEKFNIESDYPFTDEFFIYKIGKSGYYLDNTQCELFNIKDLIDNITRFVKICESYEYKYRIITSDGQYTLDITKKINELDKVDRSDIVEETHLHHKKSRHPNRLNNIDLENIKFISLQLLK